MSDPIGRQLGQYQLIELIHRRATSAVYKAYQPSLDRFVAIKVLFSNGDPQFALRFKRSSRMSAGLNHPNILPTYDFGEQDNLLFIVLQYVEGGVTLDSMLGAPLDLPNAVLVMTRLLSALDYAHQRGIIHRDVKPGNIMISAPNWPLLGDFGIAKLRSDNQRFTSSGLTIGTPAYMAPEQATGRPVDLRTDLYAAGLVFYTMLTGRVPFDAETPMDMLTKHVYEQPLSPRVLNPAIPLAAEQVVLRALEKLPSARYQSASAMAEAIGELVPPPPEPPPPPPQRYHPGLETPRSDPKPAPAPSHPQNYLSSLYQAGAQAIESGRWEAAIDLFGQLVARDPANDEAADLLAAAREMQRRAQGAPAAQPSGASHASAAPTPAQPQPDAGNIPAAAEPAPQPSHASAAERVCPHCGQSIHSDWVACPYCRATLVGMPAVQAPAAPPVPEKTAAVAPPPARRRIGWLIWLAIGLILLAIVAAASLALARRAPAPASPTAAPRAAVAQATDAPTAAAPTPEPSPAPTQEPTAQPSASPAPTAVPTAVPAPTAPPDAVVIIAQLRLRAGPATNYSLLQTYPQGTALAVLGKDAAGAWLNVRAPDGQIGWMRASDLQVNIALDALPIAEAPPSPTPPPPTRRPTARPLPTATLAPTAAPTEPPVAAPTEPPTPTAAPTAPPTPTEKKEDRPRPTRPPSEPPPPK